MGPNVSGTHLKLDQNTEVRLLALVSRQMQREIRRQLAPLGVTVDYISKAADVSHLVLSRAAYQVALLPAALPGNGWWALWGEIVLLHPMPEILVYARAASFELWSGVLEMGGYDVIVEPFTDGQLQQAVTRAAASFAERHSLKQGKE
jgi:DNA-binding NtrC family response regulator